jgi:hypothetical protein
MLQVRAVGKRNFRKRTVAKPALNGFGFETLPFGTVQVRIWSFAYRRKSGAVAEPRKLGEPGGMWTVGGTWAVSKARAVTQNANEGSSGGRSGGRRRGGRGGRRGGREIGRVRARNDD